MSGKRILNRARDAARRNLTGHRSPATALQDLIELLEKAASDQKRRLEHLKRFQKHIRTRKKLHHDPEIDRVLRDIARDLDFFRPDARARAQNPALYEDARLEEEIRVALIKLR